MESRSVVPTLRQAQGRLLPHKTRKSGVASAMVNQRWAGTVELGLTDGQPAYVRLSDLQLCG